VCRLFGLIANKSVDLRFSMLESAKSFKDLGRKNPDGWGIGWYNQSQEAKVEKHGENVFYSVGFDELVKEVVSSISIAHVRYASDRKTKGKAKNAHPFLYNNYIFAHNGTVNKTRLEPLLKPPYNQNYSSDSVDSEIYFRLLIQQISEKGNLKDGIIDAIKYVIKDDTGANFVLSDGINLYAYEHGKSLYYLKRDLKKPFSGQSKETFAFLESKRASQETAILVCSEALTDENWVEFNKNLLIIADKEMNLEQIEVS